MRIYPFSFRYAARAQGYSSLLRQLGQKAYVPQRSFPARILSNHFRSSKIFCCVLKFTTSSPFFIILFFGNYSTFSTVFLTYAINPRRNRRGRTFSVTPSATELMQLPLQSAANRFFFRIPSFYTLKQFRVQSSVRRAVFPASHKLKRMNQYCIICQKIWNMQPFLHRNHL